MAILGIADRLSALTIGATGNASGTQLQRYIHGPGAGDDPLIH
ncbi:hypothetical protein [Pontixanthobacter gangjinensis]|nr:hypothetical protein [Pontixanthobacter gangjinensis]